MLPVSVGCEVTHTVGAARRLMVSFPGAGHFLPIEAPDAAEDIAWFLDSESGKPARPPVGTVQDCAR